MTLTPAHLAFGALCVVTLVGALAAVLLRNVLHALVGVVVFFLGVAGVFFSLRADFIGVVQILVYVGAVAVLIVFAIVLTRSGQDPLEPRGAPRWFGALTAAVTGGGLVAVLIRTPPEAAAKALPSATTSDIGVAMLTGAALPFELASVLLTAALIGAAVIAMDEIRVKR